MLVPPTSATAIINNLVARELLNSSGPVEPVSATVGILSRLIRAMSGGEDIADIKEALTRIVTNQQEKAKIYASVLNQIDQERSMDWIIVRAQVEKLVKRASLRGDMSTPELMAVWHLANDSITTTQNRQDKTESVDTVTIVEKVDVSRQESEHSAQQRWENTTPQGREIIRKKLFTLKREVMTNQQAAQGGLQVTIQKTTGIGQNTA